MVKRVVQCAKQAEVEVKVELSRLLQSQPWPEPQPFRQLADFFRILLVATGDDTDRSAGATGDLHRQSYKCGAGRRDFFEPRHVFETIQTGLAKN